MSHEKAKEQPKNKKEPTKSLKEKRAAKKAKKSEKNRLQIDISVRRPDNR